MIVYPIDANTAHSDLLDYIEKNVIRKNEKHIFLQIKGKLSDDQLQDFVTVIKEHYDIFILVKTKDLNNKNAIESFFTSGIHGIWFEQNKEWLTDLEEKNLNLAVQLFAPGSVLLDVQENRTNIQKALDLKVIPVVKTEDSSIKNWIMELPSFAQLTSGIAKYIPVYNPVTITIKDRLRIKILLESKNIRNKIMVKDVEESFNSSSL